MVQSVELLLDEAAEQRILGEWARLIAAGLPSQGRHPGASNRPHITVAVAGELGVDEEVAVAEVTEGNVPLTLVIGGALVFGSRTFVLSRTVVPTVDLLAVQRRITEAMGAQGRFTPHQAPGRWTPHVTLARRLTAAQVATALDVLAPIEPIDARTVAVRRWDSDRKSDWLIG